MAEGTYQGKLTLRLLADVAYVIWRDDLVEEARSAQVVAAVLKASGRYKTSDGREIEVPDPVKVRDDFDEALARPLDYERTRRAVLTAVQQA